MVSKNWKLFVARLSGFWLRKILLDHPKKKKIPAKTKKMEGTNVPDPLPVANHKSFVIPGTGEFTYLFIGQNHGQYFVHRLGVKVKWYLSFSCAVSHLTECAHMYLCRQYHGYVHSLTRQELQESNHPTDKIGSHCGISVDLLLAQPI
jgi:hypothetical protein